MERNTDHTLRLLTIIAWVPAFALLLPHGIITETLCPVLGIIPMTFSALTGLVHLVGKAKYRAGNIVMDLFCACFLLSILIPGWVFMAGDSSYMRYSRYWGYNVAPLTMVGTYGMVPMVMSFIIHAWFVLREIKTSLFAKKTCPHCNGSLAHSGRQTNPAYQYVAAEDEPATEHSKESSSSDRLVDAEEGRASDARPSTDDENARLL